MSTTSVQDRARLRIVTFENALPEHAVSVPMAVACTGAYDCHCESCDGERRERVLRGVQRTKGNPLAPRPARRAA